MRRIFFRVILILVAATGTFLFRAHERAKKSSTGLEEKKVEMMVKLLQKPSIAVTKSDTTTGSYMGGAPPASPLLKWPTRQGRPLSFIACIDCAELPRHEGLEWLPQEGRLLFFFDMVDQPWGFDPKDKDGFATIYLPASAVQGKAVAKPPTPLAAEAVIPQRFLKFDLRMLPPSWETAEVEALKMTDGESDSYSDLRSELYGNEPHHQIGGYADPVQNPEMDEESQLASNGLYCGDATGYNDPRAAELRKGAKDWSLLFQMDSDEDLKVMWGDAGMIYFWIRRDDAKALKFDHSWVILQCG